LPASSNLLGICLVILNFVNLWKVGRVEKVVIDKMVGVSMFLILIASVMSYIPMRSQMKADVQKNADIVLFLRLTSLMIIAAI